MSNDVPKSFEERLNDVQSIIEGIESGKLPLEESVRRFEAGIQVLNGMEKELEEMKRRITLAQQQPDGTIRETVAEGYQ